MVGMLDLTVNYEYHGIQNNKKFEYIFGGDVDIASNLTFVEEKTSSVIKSWTFSLEAYPVLVWYSL